MLVLYVSLINAKVKVRETGCFEEYQHLLVLLLLGLMLHLIYAL